MKPEAPGHGVWIAVCDGAKAMILENIGSAGSVKLKLHHIETQDNPPSHLQGRDAPGRVLVTPGRRATAEAPDPHLREEDLFIANFAMQLELHLRAVDAAGLVLVAPAHALHVLRGCLGKTSRRLLREELDRDYAGLSLAHIEENLQTFYGQPT